MKEEQEKGPSVKEVLSFIACLLLFSVVGPLIAALVQLGSIVIGWEIGWRLATSESFFF